MSYWGPVYCQICWGKGYITVPVQQNNPAFQGNKVAVEVTGVDCKGHGGSLCSCTTYKGYRIAGTNNYTGACQNYVHGHKCGHGPDACFRRHETIGRRTFRSPRQIPASAR